MQSVFSIIILDDIERLLEYVAIGPRFSNTVLQTLLVLLKKQPPKGRKLLVLGTTSAGAVMEDMEVSTTFNVVLNVPKLKEPEITTVLKSLRAFAPDEVGSPSTLIMSMYNGLPLYIAMITRPMAVLAALHRSQCYTFKMVVSMLKLNELATMVQLTQSSCSCGYQATAMSWHVSSWPYTIHV